MRRSFAALLLICTLGFTGVIAAQSENAVVNESAAVREALAPFATLMQRLPPDLSAHLVKRAEAWVSLTAEEQQLLRQNLTAWEQRAPLERLVLRERFEAWEHLDDQTREAALAAAQHFSELSEETQQGWRDRFAALDVAQRQRYLFDPQNRLAMDLANDLFRFVPAHEQIETLAMLRALTPDQVAALRKAVARLPPPRRDAYRQRLLELDPAARAAELDARP